MESDPSERADVDIQSLRGLVLGAFILDEMILGIEERVERGGMVHRSANDFGFQRGYRHWSHRHVYSEWLQSRYQDPQIARDQPNGFFYNSIILQHLVMAW